MRRFSIVTYGCQMNEHDSIRIAELLRRSGYEEGTTPEEADLVLLNTCSVRDKAEQKLRSEVGRLGLRKRREPGLILVVAGCVGQQEGKRLLRDLPQLDLVLGPDAIPELPLLLAEVEAGGGQLARTGFDEEAPRFLSADPLPGAQPPVAYVTVMKGCNERCSYCIVPFTRGPERYRPAREILHEVAQLVAAGVAEIQLLGQTVNSYRDPEGTLGPAPGSGETGWLHTSRAVAAEDESEFAALLRAIVAVAPELKRIRYASPHPRHLTRSLIAAHGDLPQLALQVHMPMQSGSDRILRRMIRRYTAAEYRERTDALRAAVPGLTLSTDIIVGFPGETEEDHRATIEMVLDRGFVNVFGFKYSPRPGTPSLKLPDDVSEEDKTRRIVELFDCSEGLRQAFLAGLVGTHQEVLVEGLGRNDQLTGRTARNEIVHFSGPRSAVGRILSLEIDQAFKHSLHGVLRESDLSSCSPADTAPPATAQRRLPIATA